MVVISYREKYTQPQCEIGWWHYQKNIGWGSDRPITSGEKNFVDSKIMVSCILGSVRIKKTKINSRRNVPSKSSSLNEHWITIFGRQYILYLVWNLLSFQLGYNIASSIFYFLHWSILSRTYILPIKKAL